MSVTVRSAARVLDLDFHGAAVSVLCQDSDLVERLARDFAYFILPDSRRSGGTAADSVLEVRVEPVPQDRLPRGQGLSWRSARISTKGSVRSVDYGGQALLVYDLAAERGTLCGPDRDLLHELAYLAVLSRAGDLLDGQGLHRAHALGFSFRGRGGLLFLPMNGGKSRLALELLSRPGFALLSDDLPLIEAHGRTLRAFPLRLGLRGSDAAGIPESFVRTFKRRRFGVKRLVDVAYFQDRIADRAPLDWIFVASRNGAQAPSLVPCSKPEAASSLLAPVVLGLGLPQVLELMLPPPPFIPGSLRLARIAGRRLAACLRAAEQAECSRLRLCDDPAANADLMAAYLEADLSKRSP
ncbi:MAG: hypothetical protein HY924_15040 [Elusimicrobia bacterium]|nr:hypothetical protein [Elusimicrobiota bacterium]